MTTPRAVIRAKNGANCLFVRECRTRFLLNMKDSGHPQAACRGKLALIGGAVSEEDEGDPERAIRRELGEEFFGHDALLALILPLIRLWRVFTLDGREYPGTYDSTVFVAVLPAELFDRLAAVSFSEGFLFVAERQHVEAWLSNPELHTVFLSSQGTVLEVYLAEHKL